MVGRLVPVKNYEFIINALSNLENLKFELHIYGDGILKESLKNLVLNLDMIDCVHFHGLVTREKLFRELSRYDIFINSSFYEGFGNALIEAKLAGLKVLAPNLEVFREVLEDSIYYFINNDQDSFISLLYEVLDKNNMKNDVQYIAQKYSLKTHVKNVTEFYKTILNVGLK